MLVSRSFLLLATQALRLTTSTAATAATAARMSSSLPTPASSARNSKSRSFVSGPPASTSGIDLYSVKTPNGLKVRS